MRFLAVAALSIGIVAAGTAAQAESLDLRKVTCGEFLKQDKDFHGQILMWLTGYSTSEDDEPTIDFDSVIETGKKLGAYCAQNSNASVMTAYENASK